MGAIGIGPSLALRQRGWVRGFDFMGGVLPVGATLTRASPGVRWTPQGVLATLGADVARFDHHPVTGAPRGLLIEGAQTNALARSGALGSTPWSAASVVLSEGQASPDGGTAATLVNDNAAASYGQVLQSFGATSGTVCLSAYVRKDAVGKATRFALLRLGGNIDLGIDTATGEVADVRGNASGHGVEDCGAWWRVWIATGASVASVTLHPACGAGAMTLASFNGAVVGATAVWGVQVEGRATPSSYIATGASAWTRAADVLTLNWGMLGVADGPVTIRYTFDDLSSQDGAATIAGGVTIVPTNLARARLRSARIV
ncbi:hypothetical protein ABS767_03135 [Sphingomonas sp. ST-64]|uniref:Uncharacterized protein n=1 Tax=Sphingomonas plantiphila TaxID=3163295 RepID=A0ABW8YIP6_9SPHN